MVIAHGDHVLVWRGKHSWLIHIEQGKSLHTHLGIIQHDAIVGMEFGDEYKLPDSNIGFMLVKPLLHELATHFARKTQIVYPADTGFIIVNMGVTPGSRILEAGTGSGALTVQLAAIAGAIPPGIVVSYDILQEHHENARNNIQSAGYGNMVDLRVGDLANLTVQDRLKNETAFDACFLDLPAPWELVFFMHDILIPGGIFCSFSPVIEQVKRVIKSLRDGPWTGIRAVDLQVRSWQVKENATRPLSHGHHTGYLVFARKVNVIPPPIWDRKARKELIRQIRRDEGNDWDSIEALEDDLLGFLDDDEEDND